MNEKPPKLRLERSKRVPSERNQQIYSDVRLQGQSQAEVAQRHGMTQGRVSSICQQIDRWVNWAKSAPDDGKLAAQRRRMTLLQSRQRCEQIYLTAVMQMLEQSCVHLTEHISDRSGQTVSERTERQIPINVQWLKIASKASKDIARLDEKLGVDVAPSAMGEHLDKFLCEYLERTAALNSLQVGEASGTTPSGECRPQGSETCQEARSAACS